MGKVLRTCKTCGKEFSVFPYKIAEGKGKYCSKQCYSKDRHIGDRGGSITKSCWNCGKEFSVSKSKAYNNRGHYCSNECKHAGRKTRVEINCSVCGKRFSVNQFRLMKQNAKYCSSKCRTIGVSTKYEVSCKTCGKMFFTSPSRVLKYCSRDCMGKDKRQGNSHLWKGGYSDYRGDNWAEQRDAAYQRDGGVCQYCQRKPKTGEKKFAIHHIKPFREFDGDYISANDLANLITLCPNCHMRAEWGSIPVPQRLL